nr:MAG TPA: hypothetical protein [Caudoviricetes sp.]
MVLSKRGWYGDPTYVLEDSPDPYNYSLKTV